MEKNSIKIWSQFRSAVKQKNVARISKIITEEDIYLTEASTGKTFLHFAAEHGTVEIVNLLLKLKPNIHLLSSYNVEIPIFFAVKHSFEMVKIFLDDETIIDAKLLGHALFFGTEETVRIFLQHTTDSKYAENVSNDRNQVLDDQQFAKDLIKVFLRDKQYTLTGNKKEKIYMLLFFFTARIGKENILQSILNYSSRFLAQVTNKSEQNTSYLVELNARGDKGETALHYAVSRQNVDAVRFLLNQRADPNCKSNANLTPLHYAARLANQEICQLLLNFGANPNSNQHSASSPLHLVCGISGKLNSEYHWFDEFTKDVFRGFNTKKVYNHEIMKLLLQHGADPNNSGTYYGHKPLFRAVIDSRFEETKTLIKFGANVRIVDGKDKDTLLHHAAWRGSIKIVKLLLNNGLEIDVENVYGNTALHDAAGAENYSFEIVDILLQEGLDIDFKNNHGNTPLMYALSKRCLSISVEHLVSHGSSLSVRNNDRETAFDIAMHKSDDSDLILTLLESGADRILKQNSGTEKPTCPHWALSNSQEALILYIALKGDNIDDYFSCCLNVYDKTKIYSRFNDAKCELEQLKSRNILDDVKKSFSYYDFLGQGLPTAMRIFKNPIMKQELSIKSTKSFKEFPFCRYLLQHRLRLVTSLEDCYDKVFNFFSKKSIKTVDRKFILPHVVIELIFSYLSPKDFRYFANNL